MLYSIVEVPPISHKSTLQESMPLKMDEILSCALNQRIYNSTLRPRQPGLLKILKIYLVKDALIEFNSHKLNASLEY